MPLATWWDFSRDNSLNAASRRLILKYRTTECLVTLNSIISVCSSEQCDGYHCGNQRRRCPFDMTTGQLIYTDMMCPDGYSACARKDTCERCHSDQELDYHPYRYKTSPCRDSLQCPRGMLCAFAHHPSELRVTPRPPVSDSDKIFLILCWADLCQSAALDLERVKNIHSSLLSVHSAESLISDGAGLLLEELLRQAASSPSTASSTIE
jgi:hypothetical protein